MNEAVLNKVFSTKQNYSFFC